VFRLLTVNTPLAYIWGGAFAKHFPNLSGKLDYFHSSQCDYVNSGRKGVPSHISPNSVNPLRHWIPRKTPRKWLQCCSSSPFTVTDLTPPNNIDWTIEYCRQLLCGPKIWSKLQVRQYKNSNPRVLNINYKRPQSALNIWRSIVKRNKS
jgi:hypothetical protein